MQLCSLAIKNKNGKIRGACIYSWVESPHEFSIWLNMTVLGFHQRACTSLAIRPKQKITKKGKNSRIIRLKIIVHEFGYTWNKNFAEIWQINGKALKKSIQWKILFD